MIRLTADTNLAALLSDLLRLARMTQAELARATGYAEGQVSRWLRGVVVPSFSTLARLLAALGYDLALIPREDA